MPKKLENNVGARMHPCLTPLEMAQRPIVLHLTLLTFMVLLEDGERFGGTTKAHQDFPQSIMADSIKGLGQVYKSCIKTYVLFSVFLHVHTPPTTIIS